MKIYSIKEIFILMSVNGFVWDQLRWFVLVTMKIVWRRSATTQGWALDGCEKTYPVVEALEQNLADPQVLGTPHALRSQRPY